MNEIWIAVLTGCFTLLGVSVTLWFGEKRNVLEHKRWYVDHFIGEKLQSFKKLHAALVDCHFTMNFYGNASPRTLIEFKEKISPKEETYLETMVMASIYLNEDGKRCFLKLWVLLDKRAWLSGCGCRMIKSPLIENHMVTKQNI